MRALPRHAVLLCLLAPAIAMADDPADAVLLQRANALVAAQLASDQPALEGLLAADYLEVSPVGDVDTRDVALDFVERRCWSMGHGVFLSCCVHPRPGGQCVAVLPRGVLSPHQ